jgi:dTDP-glucose pyrophosphorylase
MKGEKPLSTNATLYDVVHAIEASRRRIAVVIEESGRLLGTLTDGDVRRCLLSGGTLETLAVNAMNTKPITAQEDSTDGYLLDLMKRGNVMSVPTVNEEGHFVRMVHITDLDADKTAQGQSGFAAAVIMAGGEGTRLRPITDKIPKPMVEVGGIPLLERQVCRVAKANIPICYISVNYLSHIIEEYFGDGAHFGVHIEYLREKDKMGTAGALSFIPKRQSGTILVMNGDILTTSEFENLYNYHIQHKAKVTVAAVEYRVQIPYGVIRRQGQYVTRLEEKPSQQFLCNAGIYAMEPNALNCIPTGFFNMTDLIRCCLKAGDVVSVFPIHEYWSDIGTPDDLERARNTFTKESRKKDG